MIGTYVLSHGYYDAYYLQAQKIRRMIADDFQACFQQCDLIAGPVAPTVAWKLGEQGDDVTPGPLRVQRVISDARKQRLITPRRRVMEGVEGSAVDDQAPVDTGGLHLSGERLSLRRELNGVL